MDLLLDTHALLWWWTNDARLSARAHELIADENNRVFVSAASAWEIATKQRLGKLSQLPEAGTRFAELVALDGFEHLAVTYLHALRAGNYSWQHRDPFDRMLAAQSDLEAMALLSNDSVFSALEVATLW